MIDVKIEDSQIKVYLDKLTPTILLALRGEINKQSFLLKQTLETEYLTGGPSRTRLGVRTGHLRRSTVQMPITQTENGIQGGMSVGGSGIPYSRVHINKAGTVTTIRPKSKQWLTIPTKFALNKSGSMKAPSARDYGWSGFTGRSGAKSSIYKTSFIKINSGLAMIAANYQSGRGKNKTNILTPLFWLKKQVRVPARVHPEVILKKQAPTIQAGIQGAIARATK